MSSTRLSVFVVWALLCLISHLAYAAMPQPPQPTGKPAEQARLVADYGKLPLSFEANQGKTAEEVKFIARGPGYALFLKPDEALLTMTKPKKREALGNANQLNRHFGRECRTNRQDGRFAQLCCPKGEGQGLSLMHPDCKDASKPCHPWSLGSGAPCRNDENNFSNLEWAVRKLVNITLPLLTCEAVISKIEILRFIAQH